MKFKWLKDFEKRYLTFMLLGFGWCICWMLITFLAWTWLNLPSDSPLVFALGVVMLVGFVYFQGWGIIILAKGLFSDLKKQIKEIRNK